MDILEQYFTVGAVTVLRRRAQLARQNRALNRAATYDALADELEAVLPKPEKPEGQATQVGDQPHSRPRGGADFVAPAHAGDDGNFGLTDDEIMHPSRQTIIDWLSGRTPMLASHWSRIAAQMLREIDATKEVA